ncbi:MAG: YraN family protein [Alphaproteobacteria bacterium]|nr:MAG: YraN family protein [Alphaproteobacteria bacterium]
MTKARFGALGEEAAADLLRKGGYRIVARNHRCRSGEIDVIAEKGEVLVFVEVRTRATAAFGGPEETVGGRKQRRVIAAARDFLARRRGPPRAARFDVIAVVDGPAGPSLTHFENAFDTGA